MFSESPTHFFFSQTHQEFTPLSIWSMMLINKCRDIFQAKQIIANNFSFLLRGLLPLLVLGRVQIGWVIWEDKHWGWLPPVVPKRSWGWNVHLYAARLPCPHHLQEKEWNYPRPFHMHLPFWNFFYCDSQDTINCHFNQFIWKKKHIEH